MAIKNYVFCLITCFVFISEANSNKYRQNSRIISESVNHEHETCNASKYKSELRKNIKKFMCQPMDTVVHLYSKHQNMMMIPDKIVVKRCYETGCYGQNSCVANNTREIPVAVRFISGIPQRNQNKCGWVNITEHVQCTCRCNINREECEQQGKLFNPSDCTCKCSNEQNNRAQCLKQNGMEWDDETCSCRCTAQMLECTTGTEWVPKYCRCLKVMM